MTIQVKISISVNPGVIIGPDGKQLLLQKGEIRNPHDGEAFVGKYGEILDVGNGSKNCFFILIPYGLILSRPFTGTPLTRTPHVSSR